MNFKHYKKILFVLVLFNISAFAQKRENRIDEEFPTPISFPYDYFGNYSGNLRVSDYTGVVANLPSEFSFKETDVKDEFVYSLSYLQGKDKKSSTYKVFIIDQEKGFYAIKDDMGLEFTATLIDNTLYSTFEINENIMFTALEFTNNGKVKLNIILSKKINNKRTKELEKDAAKLSNVILLQKAVLSKV
ncbi:hypothetical protein Q4512_11170 [Oceanihabitans sp. 2_MG-2023]|uniref:hypothetical protein n=1 Tax=Oceanihabitans sp. 2_MG-2023 TaxID=3062661 RepID=UPI0026E4205E|nr:hypothetical protein [Oceanihabitans sp. 2_MG-2023]MDO6597477.1 hypothetical protein [Oceanihabitans sp. 2_MG-2023]